MNKKQELLNKIEEIKKEVEQLEIEENGLENFKILGDFFFESNLHDIEMSAVQVITKFNSTEDFNTFETKREAEEQAKKIKEYLKLYHVARFLNSGWEPDWTNNEEDKWFITFDNNCFMVDFRSTTREKFTRYFKSKELAEKAIKYMGWNK